MSLDQAIKHGKEHRKPYYRSERFDQTCRPHGGCPYCKNGRLLYQRKFSELMLIQESPANTLHTKHG